MAAHPSPYAADPCHGCDLERPANAHAEGWRGPYCRSCYRRWLAAGKPDIIPVPVKHIGPVTYRREDYAELIGRGHTLEQAAARLGVCKRTAERYEAALKWPEPLHDFRCCQEFPQDDPKPTCPGWAVLEQEALTEGRAA